MSLERTGLGPHSDLSAARLFCHEGVIELHAENPAYTPIRFQEHEELQVWGVVVGTVSRFTV